MGEYRVESIGSQNAKNLADHANDLDALDAYVSDPKNQVDLNRIYVMGLSMGGYGTWDAIQRRPDFFAAAVPICGGVTNHWQRNLSGFPSGLGMEKRIM